MIRRLLDWLTRADELSWHPDGVGRIQAYRRLAQARVIRPRKAKAAKPVARVVAMTDRRRA